jgi:enterochelin esterase-like enzyme
VTALIGTALIGTALIRTALIRTALDVSLLDGPLPWLLLGAGALGAVALLARRDRRWWTRSVPLALLAGAAAAGAAALLVDVVWRPFPDPLPPAVLAAVGVVATAVVLLAAGLPRRRAWGRVGAVLATAAVVAAGAQSLNGYYRQYPTLRTLLGLPAADVVPFTDVALRAPLVPAPAGRPLDQVWTAPPDIPPAGVVTQVDVPAPASGFAARSALLYLPPAYLVSPRAELPVLVLMPGQPGAPQDWFDGGQLAQRMDRYAAAHRGLAPVVVVVDQLGDPLANPLCVDSPLGAVATYLTVDVPNWVRATLQVDRDPAAWAIGGLSNGGTCSLQTAVNHPGVYPTFVDVSGEQEPTLGDRQRTLDAAFGGDPAAFAAVNPLDVLAARRFPGTAGYLVAGAQDSTYLPAARRVLAACRAAGMDVQLHVLPGGHTFAVWGPGLEGALPWLGTRLGLTS